MYRGEILKQWHQSCRPQLNRFRLEVAPRLCDSKAKALHKNFLGFAAFREDTAKLVVGRVHF